MRSKPSTADVDHRTRSAVASRRYWPWAMLVVALVSLAFLATTDDMTITALRNTANYGLSRWWENRFGAARSSGSGALYGCVRNAQNLPVPGATVLLAERDGTLHRSTADAMGCYEITAVPTGRYAPLAGAFGYEAVVVRPWGLLVPIGPGERRLLDVRLPPVSLPEAGPGADLRIGVPLTLTWELPQPSAAVRRQISYEIAGRANQLTFLYTPVDRRQPLPALLAVYPGPADQWEGVSIPLAAAGYAVIAVGPAYTLDLEADVAELQQLVAFARAGMFPGADGRRMGLLGGSYSSLHVLRLLERDAGFRGVVLLGAISDLFDLRLRFEQGRFFPPFGLDQALIALGTPDRAPERYWRYSARFRLRADLPPILVMHSRSDEVVPYQQSELLASELARLGTAHEAHFFDGMSHYLLADRPSADLSRLYALTTDFLQRTL